MEDETLDIKIINKPKNLEDIITKEQEQRNWFSF